MNARMRSQPPVLFCPFSSKVHPEAEAANVVTERWLDDYRLGDYISLSAMRSLNIGELAGMLHPTVEKDTLQLYADWCSWLFVHDDFGDAVDVGRLQRLHERMLGILGGGELRGDDEDLVVAFGDLWRRTTAAGGGGHGGRWERRFVRSVEEFFDAGVWEAKHRKSDLELDVDSYVGLRRRTSGMFMWIDLIEVSYEKNVPAQLLCDPWVRESIAIVNDVASWANDIFSAQKEMENGDPFNLVVVLFNADERRSIEDAMEEAVRLHDARVQRFLDIRSRVRASAEEYLYPFDWYIDRLQSYMRGNLDWMLKSTRRYIE